MIGSLAGSEWELWGCKQRIDFNWWRGGKIPNWGDFCSCTKRWSRDKDRKNARDNSQTLGETPGRERINTFSNGGFEEDFVRQVQGVYQPWGRLISNVSIL